MDARALARTLLCAVFAASIAGAALAQQSLRRDAGAEDRTAWRGGGLRLNPDALTFGGWGTRFDLQRFRRYELAPPYSLRGSGIEPAWRTPGYRLQWSYELARGSFGLSLASGRDAEDFLSQELAPGRQLSLFGRYWLGPDWALSAEALAPGEGSLLGRPKIRLGVQRQF